MCGYADSTNGIVEDNIFYNPDFLLSEAHLLPNTSIGTLVASDVYKFGDCSVNITDVLSFSNTSGSGGLRFLFTGSQSTYTVAIYGTNLIGKYFRVRNLDWYSYVNLTISSSIYNNNLLVYTFTLNSSSYNNIYMLQIDFSGVWTSTISWIKFEKGSSFTGYVPKDYTNYGYNQGYQIGESYGSDNSLTLKGYTRIGGLNDLTSDFYLQSVHYVQGSYTYDTLSRYTFDTPNYAIYDSTFSDSRSVRDLQIGFKYESSQLFGNILLTIPVVNTDFTVVFIDTVTRCYVVC